MVKSITFDLECTTVRRKQYTWNVPVGFLVKNSIDKNPNQRRELLFHHSLFTINFDYG